MEDQPGAHEHCARMNNQRMTMRDITELMELVTAMLSAFRRWNGGVMFVTWERLHVNWPTMKRTNTGLLVGAECPCRHSRCCSRAPLDGLDGPDGNPSVNTVDGQKGSTNGKHVEEIGGEGGAPVVCLLHLAVLKQLDID